ncbi:pyridoxamine 5'-phosphate oxidase family protein [Aquihabitans sp. McL0605]|uniref:pyridoxamine 5'-phosphate oxidase family protein n=1 Tax=Aquihabitans sp. McL0605 TaxID=3415671 RepID=UPI003CF6CAE3
MWADPIDVVTNGPVGRRQACFEVDGFDRPSRSGWSVVVRGRLEEVPATDHATRAELEGLVEPWTRGDDPHVVRLVPTVITGRRIRPRPAPRKPSPSPVG